MSGVLWGLLGALLIGGSDCLARVTAQRVSSSVLFVFIMGMSLAALSVWAGLRDAWPIWHAWAWGASAISGLLNLVALFLLYRALSRGPVTVASPAASTFAVMLVAMNAMTGAAWSWLQLVAVGIVFFGVVMLARKDTAGSIDAAYDSQWLKVTAWYGLAAAVAVSVRMFLAQEAGAVIGPITALYLNRLFALIGALVLLLVLYLRKNKLSWPTGRLTGLVFLQAVLETGALAAFLIGSAGDGRVAAAIGFSAFAAATALFAWFWLGEKIGLRRGIWLTVVATGILLAVVGSP